MNSNEEKLHGAIRSNNRTAVEDLLQRGVDLNCIYYGTTPLLVAIDNGNVDLACLLIERGCNIKTTDLHQGISPFQEAVKNDQVQVVKALVKAGADVNQSVVTEETPLTYAATKKLTYLTQALIDCKCDVNKTNKKGHSPLYIAASEGHTGIVEQLLNAQVNKNEKCSVDEYSPLTISVLNERMSVVRLLLKSGVDINAQDSHGWTPLYHAVCDSNDAMVRVLLKSNASKFVQAHDGSTVTSYVKENDMEDMAELLG